MTAGPTRTRAPRRPGAEPAPPDVPGLSARRAAAASVADVLRTGAPLEDALARAPATDDPALARAIAVATFRRFGTIWRALETRLAKGMPGDPAALAILATGAAQILVLAVPDHAAVDLSVRLAGGEKRLVHLTGLANAVLRRIARERDAILAAESDPLRDAPDWLAARWSEFYGPERARAIAAIHRAGATLDLTVRDDPAAWAERLGGTVLPTGSVRVADPRPVAALDGYADGAWWVQDAAAALPARLLDVRPGERVADLCAAPGGKTAQLAAAGGVVTALDRSAKRLDRLRANLARLGLRAEIVRADATGWEADPFDAVLLDAPCTATGTIRRHPDVAWTKRARDIESLTALQTRLLDRAAGLVRPGGRLVYCVCSLEPAEGEDAAAGFLARHPEFRRDPVRPDRDGIPAAFVSASGDLRTTPDGFPDEGRPGLDGFFAARFVRRASESGLTDG